MADVRPFRALRPRDDLAARVIAPPYDVLSEDEARDIARERLSFLRVTRSEVDLPPGTDAHSDAAYRKARENLDAFRKDGTLVLDPAPTYYFYGQVMGDHRQIGILAGCSVAEYDRNDIRKHEYTRPDKEDDRTHHMEVLDAQVGLVFLAYRGTQALTDLTDRVTSGPPAWHVTTDDGVQHMLWVAPPQLVGPIRDAFAQVPVLYIADGHHRSAAASRVHARRQDPASAYFLAGLYRAEDLQVLAYNRVVHDLNGRTPDAFVQALSKDFEVLPTDETIPPRRGTFTMYLGGRWHLLTPRPGVVDVTDPVRRLDVSVLQDRVLGPLLGIDDPRRSTRITFVGGIRGAGALEKAVDAGNPPGGAGRAGTGVAFHCYPTGMDQLFDVADKNEVMPPKSTWFEPKLREGVAIRLLGD